MLGCDVKIDPIMNGEFPDYQRPRFIFHRQMKRWYCDFISDYNLEAGL